MWTSVQVTNYRRQDRKGLWKKAGKFYLYVP
jgi:hypothetical protein